MKIDNLLIFVIVAVSIILLYSIVVVTGPQWDMIVRYLDGRTLLDFFTHNISAHTAFQGESTNNLLYYFETYREPVSTPIFAVLTAIFRIPIIPYITLALFAYIFAFYKLGNQLKIDNLILFAGFLNVYLLYFLFLVNGGEALCIIFVLIGLVYLLRKDPISGLFFGLAAMSKYPALAIFPIVLLLDDRKKITKAFALELLPVLLWMLFDYVMYGNPVFSFVASATNAGVNTGYSLSQLSEGAIINVMVYPIVFALIGIGFLILERKKHKFRLKINYTTKVLAAFAGLATLGYIIILPHNDPLTEMRYGFLFSVALLIPATMILSNAAQRSNFVKYSVAICTVLVALITLYFVYQLSQIPKTAYYNPANQNGIYVYSEKVLSNSGFTNCRLISNAWVPMIYSGYDAYSPFSDGYANHLEYPIVVFKYTGVPSSVITNLNQSKLIYSDSNLSVYLPQGAGCYPS